MRRWRKILRGGEGDNKPGLRSIRATKNRSGKKPIEQEET
jgi:hypothetical protein